MKILTKYEERKNEEKNGVELYFESIPTPEEREELKKNGYKWSKFNKCWYKSLGIKKVIKKESNLKALKKLDSEEVEELSKKLWNTPDMQKYIVNTYDFYKTQDGLIIELQKTNKIAIDKTMWYDDETEGPDVNEKNFINYNNSNMPGRNLDAYLQEKENLKINGCASGRYDYNGIYFVGINYKQDYLVNCDWFDYDNNKRDFKRYLTIEEQEDFIKLTEERKQQYIERLKRYFKRYGQHVRARGYWVNR